MNHTLNHKQPYGPILVFCCLCLIWGSTWLAIKVGLDYFSPFLFAGIRFLIGGSVLVIPLLLMGKRYPREIQAWVFMCRLGIFQIVIPYALVFWGEQYISSGLAAILFAIIPFFVTIIAHYAIPGEQWSLIKFSGMVVSFTGLIIIFIKDLMLDSQSVWGGYAIVGAALSAAIANVIGKRSGTHYNPLINVSVQLSLGGIVLTALSLIIEPHMRWSFAFPAIGAMLFLSLFGSSLGFVGLYWLFTKMEVTKVSMISFITPVVAVLCGAIFLGEHITLNIIIGTILILTGVYLVTLQRSHHASTFSHD
ncbi:MAG: EamA family transporter [Bacteroidota bacterium]